MFGTVWAITFIGLYDRFGIAVGVKGVAKLLEFFAKLAIVIDFPVVDDPGSLVLIMDRLLPSLYINYGEPPHAKTNWSIHVEAVIIRTSMTDGIAHSFQQALVDV